MEAALIALVGVLLGHLLTAHFRAKEQKAAQLNALASFLDSIASCLEEMQKELASHRVPTAAGNRLKVQIREYEQILDESGIDERSRGALAVVLMEISRCLVQGQAEDNILRGHILRRNDKDRTDLLADLLRTGAKLRGEAETIRAKAV